MSRRCLHGWALMSWGQVQLTCPLTHSLVTRGGPFWSVLGQKHKLSLCSWGTLGVFLVEKICPPIHTPDSYPIHTPIHTLLLPFVAKSLLRSGQYQRSYAAQIFRRHKTQREALQEPTRGSFRRSVYIYIYRYLIFIDDMCIVYIYIYGMYSICICTLSPTNVEVWEAEVREVSFQSPCTYR